MEAGVWPWMMEEQSQEIGFDFGARVCVEGLGLSMDFDLEFVMEVVVWV